jgi:NADP-dependent 3-hydroxy acid dehydrogenase YdfG
MDLQLHDRVAVVIGACAGIGLPVVHLLAAEGAKVFARARTIDRLLGLDRYLIDGGLVKTM